MEDFCNVLLKAQAKQQAESRKASK